MIERESNEYANRSVDIDLCLKMRVEINLSTSKVRGSTSWADRITYEGKRVFFSASEMLVLVRRVQNACLGMCLGS